MHQKRNFVEDPGIELEIDGSREPNFCRAGKALGKRRMRKWGGGFATVAVLFVTVNASCTSDMDCPRGKMCKFRGVKDSRGECYGRGEGPPTPRVHRRAYPIDYEEVFAREVEDYDWN